MISSSLLLLVGILVFSAPSAVWPFSATPISPRKAQFLNEVEQALSSQWETGQVDRIHRFVRCCRGQESFSPLGELHQPSEEYVAELRARPWWEADEFPWANSLQENSQVILEEFRKYLLLDGSTSGSFAGDSAQMNIMGAGWSGVRLQRMGRWIPENCAKFPRTSQLLQELDIPIAVRGVIFARQLPGTGVAPHSDGRNFLLTCHFGVDVPEGKCWMRVGNEKREWRNGKALVLDTSFEHETWNAGTSSRYVLIFDFFHPDLTLAEREALAFIYELRNRYESGQVPFREPPPEPSTGPFDALKKAFFGLGG